MSFSLKAFIILAIFVRVGLFFLPSLKIDMDGWKAWSVRLVQVGPSHFYSKDYFSDYFPGYLYVLWFSGGIFSLFSLSINSLSFEIFLKFLTLLFDIGSALIIYRIVSRYNKKWSNAAPLLYILNPVTAFNNSVWGQVDGIFTFFILISSLFLFEQKKLYKSVIAITLGFLVKPHVLAIIPVLIFNSFKNFSISRIIKGIFLGFTLLIFLSFPFFTNNPISGLFNLANGAQNVYQYTSLYAFNFWGIIGAWQPDNQIFFMLTFKTWGIALYLFSTLLILFSLSKKQDLKQYYFASSLLLFSFFIFLTRMHERYLFPFFALFLIAALVKKSKLLLVFYGIISFLHFLNLWFVYYYYNFVFVSSYSKNLFLEKLYPSYIFVGNNFKLLSASMVILFGILLLYYYKSYVKKS